MLNEQNDRIWKIWVCSSCWEQLQDGGGHEITDEGEWWCRADNLTVEPLQIEVSRYLVTAL